MDCFSFGVITVQLLTRQFPKPGDCQKLLTINHPGLPKTLYTPVSEIDRQRNHIDLIDQNNPLLSIAIDCLKDMNIEHPSAVELCRRVATLKEGSEYSDSMRGSQESEQRTEQALSPSKKDRQIVELQVKVQQLMKELAQKNDIIAACTSQEEVGKLKQQHGLEMQRLQEKVQSLSRQLEETERQLEQQYTNNRHQKEESGESKISLRGENSTAVSSSHGYGLLKRNII